MAARTDLDTEKYRRLLLKERDALKQGILGRTELPPDYKDDNVLDSGDRSVMEHSMDLEGQVMEMRSDRLEQINAALQRIDRGVYGICIKCGKQISRKRLEAEPAALTCMDCLPAGEKNFNPPTM